MQAVILAAGLGSRFRESYGMPKGFIRLGEEPIIVRSIKLLQQHGIGEIVLVTGYAAGFYNQLAQKVLGVNTLFNPHYHCRGSLYSLYCAKEALKEDFLLLESDLLYEPRALQKILATNSDAILLSKPSYSGDEIYVEAHHHQLVNMSKQRVCLNRSQILGEFVGISKLTLDNFHQLIAILDKDTKLLQSGHYEEDGLVALARREPIDCLKISDLLWCEIDNQFHFEKAKKLYGQLYLERS